MKAEIIVHTKWAEGDASDFYLIRIEGDVPPFRTHERNFDAAERSVKELEKMLKEKGVKVTITWTMQCKSCHREVDEWSIQGLCGQCWKRVEGVNS